MNDGVDFWWLDWQQHLNDYKIPQLNNVFWCNYLFFTDMERNGNKRPMLYHRWGGLGNHRYQIGFSGDAFITWKSLDFLPYFNATASNVLYGYWSHDIGGHFSHIYNTPVEPQLYTRAMQLGQYLPIMRTHSSKDAALNKEPWAFGKTTEARLAKVIRGRYTLVPYIYATARNAYETGVSLCRPLYYDYPEAKEAYEYRNEYMFGDQMLIAPITAPVDSVDGYSRLKVWLPEGQWLEYETGTTLKGGQTLDRAFTMDEYPVYVKAGSIIPYFGKLKNLSGTNQAVTVRVFPGADKGQFAMYEDNGEDPDYVEQYATTPLSYQRDGGKLTVTIGARKGQYKDMPAQRNFKLALPCQMAPQSIAINGRQIDFEYDGNALETTADLGMIDCAAGATIEVQMPADYCITDGTKARFARIRTAVADFKQKNENMVYTKPFAYLEAAPIRLTYHPETTAETLAQFNEYYNDLGQIVLDQTQKVKSYDRFMSLVNERDNMSLVKVPTSAFQTPQGEGFDVKYYNNKTLEGDPVTTGRMAELDFSTMKPIAEGVKSDYWSMTAESELTIPADGEMLIVIAGDDGYRLYLDGNVVLEDWRDHALTTRSKTISVKAGQKMKVRVDFFDNNNEATLNLGMMIMPIKK